jgi:RND family efflux transporter MFP subunit
MGTKIKIFFSKALTWWISLKKRYKVLSLAGLAIVVMIVVNAGSPEAGTVVETVRRQTLTRTVIASGKVVSATDLSLGFEVSDVVRDIRVVVGQKVKKGDVLVSLNTAEERASVTAARGALLAAEARYKRVLDGSSNEEIALAQVNVQNAERDLALTKQTQAVLVENARRKLFSEGLIAESTTGTTLSNTPLISGTYTGAEGEYELSISALGGDFIRFSGIESGTAKISTTSAQPFGTKGLTILFPSNSSSAQGGSWKVRIPNTGGVSYVTNLNAYNQAKETQEAAIAAAEAVLLQRQAELNLKRATARQPDVDAALADVITGQAGVEQALARLEKKILRAPADGTVTRVSVKVGEIVTPQKEVVVVQDVANLYLEANIGEGSISTVALGQSVSVSYDAFPGTSYTASISSIDPSATEEGTIVNYKIKALLTDISMVKPGMTANMTIVTAEIPDILVVPARVIKKNDTGEQYVDKIVETRGRREKTQEVVVTTGLRGDGDILEIKTGLTEGDRILWRATQ